MDRQERVSARGVDVEANEEQKETARTLNGVEGED